MRTRPGQGTPPRHEGLKVPPTDTRHSAGRKGAKGTRRGFLSLTDEGPKGGNTSAGQGPGRRSWAGQPRGSTKDQEEGSDA